jgi:hypothetical protein
MMSKPAFCTRCKIVASHSCTAGVCAATLPLQSTVDAFEMNRHEEQQSSYRPYEFLTILMNASPDRHDKIMLATRLTYIFDISNKRSHAPM